MTRKDRDNHLKRPVDSYSKTLKEYRNLALRTELTEIEAKRLEHILESACSDDMLSLLINEVDEALFNAQKCSEHHNYYEIQNEAARTVELIGGEIPCHKKVFANAKLNLAAYEPILEEYSQLLQVSTLSEADATRMEQILDAAYEDELLLLLLNTIDEQLEGTPKVAQTKLVQIGAPSRKVVGSYRRRSATSVIESLLIACSLLLAAAPLAMNLQPQTSPQQEWITSSNDFSMDQPIEFNFENSIISPGEKDVLAQMAPQSSYENDVLEEEIIIPKVTDNSLNLDTGDLFSTMTEFGAEVIEPGSRESLPPQEAITETDIAINIPALEAIKEDTEDGFIMPSYNYEMEEIEDENSEEASDNDLPKPVRPDTNGEQRPSDINLNLNGFPDENHKLEIAGRRNNPNQTEESEEEQILQQGHHFETHFISADRHLSPNDQDTSQNRFFLVGSTFPNAGISAATNIQANAVTFLDDSQVIVWTDISLRSHGDISLRSHGDISLRSHGDISLRSHGDISLRGETISGDGGFVKVSATDSANLQGIPGTNTGNGGAITLLLDPENIKFVNTSEDGNLPSNVILQAGSITLNDLEETLTSRGGEISITNFLIAVQNDNNNILADATSGNGGQISIEVNEIFGLTPRHNIPTSNRNTNAPSLSIIEFGQRNSIRQTDLLGYGDGLSNEYAQTESSDSFDVSYSLPVIPRYDELRLAASPTSSRIIEAPSAPLDIESESQTNELSFREPLVLKPTDSNAPDATSEELIEETIASTTPDHRRGSISIVSELSDVLPSDWGYIALQNLVEKYGCLVSYPNRSYRSSRAMTRYEFAAGLNACLDVIVQAIDSIEVNDIDTIHRLQTEFAAELATIRGHVDTLAADVEASVFSTTTTLKGQVNTHLVVPFSTPNTNNETLFEYHAHLNFDINLLAEARLNISPQPSEIAGSLNASGSSLNNQNAPHNSRPGNGSLDNIYYSFSPDEELDESWMGGVAISDFLSIGHLTGIYYTDDFEDNKVAEDYYSIRMNDYWIMTPAVLYGEPDTDNNNRNQYSVIHPTFRF